MTPAVSRLGELAQALVEIRGSISRHTGNVERSQLRFAVHQVRHALERIEAAIEQSDTAPKELLVEIPVYAKPMRRTLPDPALAVKVPQQAQGKVTP